MTRSEVANYIDLDEIWMFVLQEIEHSYSVFRE